MKVLDWISVTAALCAGVVSWSCTPGGQDTTTSGTSITTRGGDDDDDDDSAAETSDDDDDGDDDDDMSGGIRLDTIDAEDIGCITGEVACPNKIDLLFVIDNSGTMAVEQENLARNFPLLIRTLENLTDEEGRRANVDVNIMVTTTDFGGPLCEPFEHPDYEPAKGAPISSTCLDREPRFTGLALSDTEEPAQEFQACQNVCTNPDAAPMGDPFINLNPMGDNIPDSVTPLDLDGDGVEDSAVAQALSCIGPQGIDGCGYEAPLETMLQALYTSATWNTGDRPFLRKDATLAIAIITDEADCSIKDYNVLTNAEFQGVDPGDERAKPSSAVCWNAGVSCVDAEGDGVYETCISEDNGMLHATSRYIDYLNYLATGFDGERDVIMLGILGVPPVTAHAEEPPFNPIAGGVFDLIYRDWVESDILPDEALAGSTAAEKQFLFGVGPGCTGGDAATGFTGQAIPPVRIKEVCESLNKTDDEGNITDVRCCIESICDRDYSAALQCLTGIIQGIVTPSG